MLDKVDFVEVKTDVVPGGLPYVTHEGKLTIGEIEVMVYVLNTGERIIPAGEIERLFGMQ